MDGSCGSSLSLTVNIDQKVLRWTLVLQTNQKVKYFIVTHARITTSSIDSNKK